MAAPSPSEVDVAIVGAGFAGLACAARLRTRGFEDVAIFEKGADVGAFWRANYDRIRLHSPFHDLPDDGGERRRLGVFLARDELVAYFERYARRHALYDWLHAGTEVTRVARDGDAWRLETASGACRSQWLVVATAYNRIPVRPELPGADTYAGHLLHSREYRNAAPFSGSRVLVVGNGNSAAEIALDLADGGARSVALYSRGPRHVISLRGMGFAARIARALRIELTPKHIRAAHAYTRTHPDFRAKLLEKDAFFSKFSIDLSRYGIRTPNVGPATQISLHGRVPWMDQGSAKAIRAGRIEVIDGNERPLEGLTPDGAIFGGRETPLDAVILATGFAPGLEAFLEDADRLLYWNPEMGRRMPDTDGRSRSRHEPTLFFPGFDLSANGGLSLGLWGAEAADAIAVT